MHRGISLKKVRYVSRAAMRNYFLGITLFILPMSPVASAAEGFTPTGCSLISREQVTGATGGQGHTHWVVKINNIGVIVVAGAGTLEPQAEKIEANLCKAVKEIDEHLKTKSQVKAFHIEDPERGYPTIQWDRVKIVTVTKGDVDHYLNESGRDGLSCGLASGLRPLIELQMCVAEYWRQLLENAAFLTLNGEAPRYLKDFEQGKVLQKLFDQAVGTYKQRIPSESDLTTAIQQLGQGWLSKIPLSIPPGFNPLPKTPEPATHVSNWANLSLKVIDEKDKKPVQGRAWLGEQDKVEFEVVSPGHLQLVALAGDHALRVEPLPDADQRRYRTYKGQIQLVRGTNELVIGLGRLLNPWTILVELGAAFAVLLAIIGILLQFFKIDFERIKAKFTNLGISLTGAFSGQEFIESQGRTRRIEPNAVYPLWHFEETKHPQISAVKRPDGIYILWVEGEKRREEKISPNNPRTYSYGSEKTIKVIMVQEKKNVLLLFPRPVYRFEIEETAGGVQQKGQPQKEEPAFSPKPGGGLGPL